MGHLHEGALADAASVDKVIDAAVASVAARQGVPVAAGRPQCGARHHDAAAPGEFTDQCGGRAGLRGPPGKQLGSPDDPVNALPAAPDSELIGLGHRRTGATGRGWWHRCSTLASAVGRLTTAGPPARPAKLGG